MEYAISDIHGKRRLFEKMLNFIQFSTCDKLYVIGDCLDWGEESVQLVELMMKMPNIELLLGNHEQLCLTAYGAERKTGVVDGFAKHRWIKCGGDKTIDLLDFIPRERRLNLIDYIQQAPMYKILEHFLLAHAGIDLTLRISESESVEELLQKQDFENFLWLHGDFYDHKAFENRKVIFGHTPTWHLFKRFEQEVPKVGTIWRDPRFGDKIAIDCGASLPEYGGRLSCLRLDDLEEFYVV